MSIDKNVIIVKTCNDKWSEGGLFMGKERGHVNWMDQIFKEYER